MFAGLRHYLRSQGSEPTELARIYAYSHRSAGVGASRDPRAVDDCS
jgi:hypothetical protein